MSPSIRGALCFVALLSGSLVVLAANHHREQSSLKQNVTEEMNSITNSLEDLLGELALIKREATGRLSLVKNRVVEPASGVVNQEQIRQTKVSRFVLKRVAELESESLSMRDELAKLFAANGDNKKPMQPVLYYNPALTAQTRLQEDLGDFDEPAPVSTTETHQGMPATTSTTTAKPTPEQEEAAKIGFDMEALKKLGEEIGKRLDQFGKDAAKNLNDLIEGVKLVFRDPAAKGNSTNAATSL